MDSKHRRRLIDLDNPSTEPELPSDESSSRNQEEADQLLAAGDRAIRRALSRNSWDFLSASRQEGGQ